MKRRFDPGKTPQKVKVKRSDLKKYQRAVAAAPQFMSVQPMYKTGGPRKEVGSHDVATVVGADIQGPIQTTPTTGGVLTLLNGPALGQGAIYQRLGNDIYGHSIHIKGFLSVMAGGGAWAAAKTTGIRIMVVYDNETHGAAPTVQQIVEDQSIAAAGKVSVAGAALYCGQKRSGTRRFYNLMDKKISLASGPSVDSASNALQNLPENQKFIDEYIKLKGLPTRFKATNGGDNPVVADVESGALWLVVIGRCEPDAAQPIEYVFNWQARYKWTE